MLASPADIPYLASLLDGLAQYFPLSLPIVCALLLLALLTSAMSAAVGVGGGTLLIIGWVWLAFSPDLPGELAWRNRLGAIGLTKLTRPGFSGQCLP